MPSEQTPTVICPNCKTPAAPRPNQTRFECTVCHHECLIAQPAFTEVLIERMVEERIADLNKQREERGHVSAEEQKIIQEGIREEMERKGLFQESTEHVTDTVIAKSRIKYVPLHMVQNWNEAEKELGAYLSACTFFAGLTVQEVLAKGALQATVFILALATSAFAGIVYYTWTKSRARRKEVDDAMEAGSMEVRFVVKEPAATGTPTAGQIGRQR